MKKLIASPIFWIFILAFILRSVSLEAIPKGFHVDEVKVGWNSLSLLKTLRDDKNNLLPLYYNTFGDYRPTGIFYITAPFVYLFGNTVFATRIASAFFGALTVFPVYFLVMQLSSSKNRKEGEKNKFVAIWSALILAIMPWHITTSRATSEVVISVFFTLLSINFFISLIKTMKIKYVLLYGTALLISYLLYHSVRLSAPIMIFAVFVYFYKRVKTLKNNRIIFVTLIFPFLLSAIMLLSPSSKGRFSQVSIFNDKDVVYEIERLNNEYIGGRKDKIFTNKYLVYIKNIAFEYGKYFSTDFLIGTSARPFRYTNPSVGLLYITDIFLLLTGIYFMLKNKDLVIVPTLFALSPLVSSLTTEDSPNLHRVLFMAPMAAIIIGYGAVGLVDIKHRNSILVTISIFLICFANITYFSYTYFSGVQNYKPFEKNFLVDSPTYRNVGNIELAKYIKSTQNTYDKIFVTNFPDSLYTWYAYFNQKNPEEFNQTSAKINSNQREYENIIFTDSKCPSDYVFNESANKILVIDSGECPVDTKIKDRLPAKVVQTLIRPDGSVSYYLLERK